MKITMSFVLALCLGSAPAFGQDGPVQAWGEQLSFCDGSLKVAADKAGNCYIAGTTASKLGPSFAGETDAFVRKYSPDGKTLWTIHVGSAGMDTATCLALAGDGGLLLGGKTMGDLAGPNSGGSDAFIVRIGFDSKIVWKRQFGTPGSDVINGLEAKENGGAYAVGETRGDLAGKNAGGADVFLLELDAAGKTVMKTQSGTVADQGGLYVAADAAGTVFVLSSANECLSFDGRGALKGSWRHELKKAWGFLADGSGGVFIGGTTGSIAILVRYDKDGKQVWRKTFGSGSWTGINSLVKTVDGSGDVLAGGCQNWENCFAFAKRFDAQGNQKEVFFLKDDDTHHTCGQEAAMDGRGDWYLTGFTTAGLFGPKNGQEAFVVKATAKK